MFPLPASSVEELRSAPVDAAELARMVEQLRIGGCTADGDAERITEIALLETLKNMASALQVQLTAQVAASREQELAHVSTESVRERARRDVGAQVGLARRVSPRVGLRLVGLAKVLTGEMPHLLGALRSGAIDEYQALLVVSETATLSLEHRRAVDAELNARYGSMTAGRTRGEAARLGYRLDPEQAVRRLRKAHADRRVSLRPAPDTMTYLTALLPAVEGVAVYAALSRHAATATALGDARGRGALMSDALVARLLRSPDAAARDGADPGETQNAWSESDVDAVDVADTVQSPVGESRRGSIAPPTAPMERVTAEESVTGTQRSRPTTPVAGPAARARIAATDEILPVGAHDRDGPDDLADGLPGVPDAVHIEIQLVMTDRTLLDGDMEPALLTGHGPIPAPLARHLARGADPRTRVWVRRLYADPATGGLTGSDPRRRLFSHADRQFLVARDQVCRTPWCGAPIRHADHVRAHAAGGPTDVGNGAGLCVACNQTKEQPGWHSTPEPDHSIVITTPTGHRYRSEPPDPPRSAPWTTHAA